MFEWLAVKTACTEVFGFPCDAVIAGGSGSVQVSMENEFMSGTSNLKVSITPCPLIRAYRAKFTLCVGCSRTCRAARSCFLQSKPHADGPRYLWQNWRTPAVDSPQRGQAIAPCTDLFVLLRRVRLRRLHFVRLLTHPCPGIVLLARWFKRVTFHGTEKLRNFFSQHAPWWTALASLSRRQRQRTSRICRVSSQ